MRINKFVAQATGLSRRSADQAVEAGKVSVNGEPAVTGAEISPEDIVKLDGQTIGLPAATQTILLNKPAGYVCSRDGQGSRTVYDLLPEELHHLKPVGRLDKDSSGLLLLTNDGDLANRLTHPRYSKEKVYEIELDRPLAPSDAAQLGQGVKLDDGPSRLQITNIDGKRLMVTMTEGRNRQIRRTFESFNYQVIQLHRTGFGPYSIAGLSSGGTRAA